MNRLGILVTLITALGALCSFADGDEPELPEDAKKAVTTLFAALKDRDLGDLYSWKLFVDEASYAKVMKGELEASAAERNWRFASDEFKEDCSKAMNQFPQSGIKTIGIVDIGGDSIRFEKKNGIETIRGVKVTCRYSLRIGRFSFIAPPMAKVGDHWQFYSRFERLVRIDWLSPDDNQ